MKIAWTNINILHKKCSKMPVMFSMRHLIYILPSILYATSYLFNQFRFKRTAVFGVWMPSHLLFQLTSNLNPTPALTVVVSCHPANQRRLFSYLEAKSSRINEFIICISFYNQAKNLAHLKEDKRKSNPLMWKSKQKERQQLINTVA